MTTNDQPPRDNLIRASFPAVEVRDAEEGGMPTLVGYFARFNEWARIDSTFEGRFLERMAPGAFAKTLRENADRIRVLFQHGRDPQVGDKPLGPIAAIREDEEGAYYEVPLLDTNYNRDLLPGLEAGLYGASFRFSVVKDDFDPTPKRSTHNPEGLPERTVREARVMEFGPVTFPAYAGATAGVRSVTFDDLDAAVTPPEPALPADGAAPEAHSDEGSRDESIAAPPQETPTLDTPKYQTPEDKEARVTELVSELSRLSEEFTGVMPIEQQARWDADTAELANLRADLAAFNQRKSYMRTLVDAGGHTEAATSAPNIVRTRTDADIYDPDQFSGTRYRTTEERTQTLRDNAMRSLDSSHLPKTTGIDALAYMLDNRDAPAVDAAPEFAGMPEIATRMIVTGSPIYKRAIAKYLRHGNTMMFTPEEQRAAALAVTGTTTTGGYAVPYVFDPTIIRIGVYTAQNPYRQACRTETISGGNTWNTVTVGAVTTVYATEAAAATEQGPTFGQPTYTVQRAQSFATVSIETLQDRPDITEELTRVFAESKATYEENQFTLGTGLTVFPLGAFVDTAYTNKDTATNDVTAIGDLAATEAVLPLRYRANAAWFMNRSTLRQFQALDTTYRVFSGAGINYPGQVNPTQPVVAGNTGITCLGYPVWEVPSAVSTLTTDGAIIAVFADPQSYVIVDRIGMNIEVIPNMLNGATPSFPTGQRGIYMYYRNTAKPLAADMGRSLSVQ